MRKYRNAEIQEVTVQDKFLSPRMAANRQVTVPYSYKRCQETGRIDAFKLDWKEGMPNRPHMYWDSDVAKVLEGMAYVAAGKSDPELEKTADALIDLIVSAQQPDGYLNCYFTVVQPEQRWKNLPTNHELYCAGHLIEAAVAYFQSTGKRKLLDAMCRYADYIDSVFGPEENKLKGYCGHEEIELALVRLYRVTGNQRYLNLAKNFVDQRGQEPNYFLEDQADSREWLINLQAHKPVREQDKAEGHAVRAVYLYSAMADIAAETGDRSLLDACNKIWNNLTSKRMYVTGGIGSTKSGESFTVDYDLPNDSAYAETCADIGLVMFASRMFNLTGDGKFMDVLERALYNGLLAGISLEGDKFFYANPLEVTGHFIEAGHVKAVRQPWFGCSCCPTNLCRFLPVMGSYLYSVGADELMINIYAAGKAEFNLVTGRVKMRVESNYPWDGDISIRFQEAASGKFTLGLRVPVWSPEITVKVNGQGLNNAIENGYVKINREWRKGDEIEVKLVMPVTALHCHPEVSCNSGRIALQRGPLVYCLESIDNKAPLGSIIIPEQQDFKLKAIDSLIPGAIAITGRAFTENPEASADLYFSGVPAKAETTFTAIPYCLWQNRGTSEMAVWIRTV
jgi:DUF1680 family protein